MPLHRLPLLLAAVAALAACSPLVLINATIPEDGFVSEVGLRYGAEDRQLLDVHRPKESAGPLPVVVFFYGGSWKRGERGDHLFAAEALTSRGYVTVVPDYRLYPEVRFPAFVEDGAKALRWVRDHAADFGGDPGRIYLMGHSAGAHIAALLTLDERYLAAEGVPATAVRGTVALAGPYAFHPSRISSIAPIFEGAAGEDAARPIAFVDGGEPPLLLLHGEDDGTVSPSNTRKLAMAVRAAGGEVREIVYPEVGHAGILVALARPFRDIAPVLEDTAAFIDGGGALSAARP